MATKGSEIGRRLKRLGTFVFVTTALGLFAFWAANSKPESVTKPGSSSPSPQKESVQRSPSKSVTDHYDPLDFVKERCRAAGVPFSDSLERIKSSEERFGRDEAIDRELARLNAAHPPLIRKAPKAIFPDPDPGGPDIIVAGIDSSEKSFQIVFQNQSHKSGGQPFSCELRLIGGQDVVTLENLKVPGPLEFGRSQEISLASLGSSESSSLLLEIKVDPGNAVRESSESNNSYVGSVKTGTKFRIPKGVNLKALPDLVVDKPEFKGGHISLRVVNIGKGWTSADFIVDIRTGGHHRNSNRHGRLSVPAPGKSRVVHLSSPHWTVGYDLEVEVDPEGRVRESDETNNVLTLTDLARPSPQELEEARNLPRMMTASEKETSYEVFQRINELRREAGVAPLERVEALDSAAVHHGRVCHFFGKGGHSSPLPGLETATRRARAALPGAQGVNEVYAGHSYTGNVTADFELKGEYFVHLWMESPGHRRAILDPNYQYIGVGVAVKGTAVNATGLLVRTLHGDPTR